MDILPGCSICLDVLCLVVFAVNLFSGIFGVVFHSVPQIVISGHVLLFLEIFPVYLYEVSMDPLLENVPFLDR